MSLFDVRHQPRAMRVLLRAAGAGRMPHAYIFAGPEGVGKEMLADRLARRLLCGAPTDRPLPPELAADFEVDRIPDACGVCEDCRIAAAGTHPDLHLVHRQLNRQHPDAAVRKQQALTLGVEVVRHFLIERACTRPLRGRAKVFIVREAERMGEAAQNALLKTLEEPPADTFIILIVSSLDRMLPTTRSRCQLVRFAALPTVFVHDSLARLRPELGATERAWAARQAEGSLGEALRLCDDGVHALKQSWGRRVADLAAGTAGLAATGLCEPFETDAKALGRLAAQRDPDMSDTDATRSGIRTLLGVLAGFYRDALRAGLGSADDPIHGDQPEVAASILRACGPASCAAALRELAQADFNFARNANLDLAIESLFIRLARLDRA